MAAPSISAAGNRAAEAAALDALRDPSAGALRAASANDPKSAIRAAAKQFEAMFMQQLMKSMRDSSMASGMLDNSGSQMGTEMLDTQYANKMAGLPGGLADVIARQLERQMNAAVVGGVPAAAQAAGAPARGAAPVPSGPGVAVTPTQEEFLRLHANSARAAAADSGIPAEFMVAQAAHESGWGRHEIRNPDGSTSHNLFGIKAGSSWKGKVTHITTTEVIDGEPRKLVAAFRAYSSYEESFRDYARLMTDNPRYADVLAAGNNPREFAQGLQRAGYATDPAYADKLTRVINTTLRVQRATARASDGAG